MKLNELQAAKIITSIMGERDGLKSDEELAVILKKRLTKKECQALNDQALGVEKSRTMTALNADEARYEAIVAAAVKKIKNESLHRELYTATAAK